MSDFDRQKWNAKYQAEPAPREPSQGLVALDRFLPRNGRALDIAGGAARHGIWLAQRGSGRNSCRHFRRWPPARAAARRRARRDDPAARNRPGATAISRRPVGPDRQRLLLAAADLTPPFPRLSRPAARSSSSSRRNATWSGMPSRRSTFCWTKANCRGWSAVWKSSISRKAGPLTTATTPSSSPAARPDCVV